MGIDTAGDLVGALCCSALTMLLIRLRSELQHVTWLCGHDWLNERCVFLRLDVPQACDDALDWSNRITMALLTLIDGLVAST